MGLISHWSNKKDLGHIVSIRPVYWIPHFSFMEKLIVSGEVLNWVSVFKDIE